ncbi:MULTISPECIES: TlpA family protein disulfide reductase [Sphingobacterium]|uniref:TlpA family protein disulfide reductase n=1 Tax=Sphingobacterium TaxID=28453 RepID=UPI0013D98465|nr:MULTISPECIES: TlpA disulfide reductase family protein [unclassified Sphingobacterium]
MMKAVKYFLGILLFLNINLANSQIKPLKIGDKLPGLGLHEVVGHPVDSLDFKEFKGKYIILDFWATWCAPCLAGFPKMKTIQEKYADRLAILPVTYEERDKIEQFFDRSEIGDLGLISIVNDNTLKRYFPHRTIPHYVWIDDKGRIVAITEEKYLTIENVDRWMEGAIISFPIKQEAMERLNDREPVFKLGNVLTLDTVNRFVPLPDSSLKYFSIITKGDIPGVIGSLVRDSTRVSYINTTVKNLYKLAFSNFDRAFLYNAKVDLLLRDSTFVNTDKVGAEVMDWIKKYGFSYELRLPKHMAHNMSNFMQEDLNRYFGSMYGIEGRLEERVLPALVLTSIGDTSFPKSESDTSMFNADLAGLKIVNRKLSWLTHHLTFTLQHLKLPILDETGIDFAIDIELDGSLSSVESVNKALLPYKLKLSKSVRKTKVLVIADLK